MSKVGESAIRGAEEALESVLLGHWESDHFCPDDWYGFIYRITNVLDGRQYIGRKNFTHTTRKKVKGRKNRKKVITEAQWRYYTSSSKQINKEIEEFGKDRFKFEIIELCLTKGDLTYRESEIQWNEKVLSAKLPTGEFKYYNRMIGAVKFRLSTSSFLPGISTSG